jgi:hypothetical protein
VSNRNGWERREDGRESGVTGGGEPAKRGDLKKWRRDEREELAVSARQSKRAWL